MIHAVSLPKKPGGHISGEQYPSNDEEHRESLDPFLQDRRLAQVLQVETPDPVENVPGKQREQLPSKIEPIPETYFPGLHIKQEIG